MIITTNTIKPLELATTQFCESLNVKIHCYMDSIRITDLTNARKRGKECKQISLSHNKADFEKPIHLYVNNFLENNDMDLKNFIKFCLNPKDLFLHDINEFDFIYYPSNVKSFNEPNPFKPLSKETKVFFDRFKFNYDQLQIIADEAVSKTDDGGTCNNDNVFIYIPLKDKEVQQASILYNIPFLSYYQNHPMFGSGYLLNLNFKGQGKKREYAVKAVYEYLLANGFSVCQWHQID